MNTLAKVPPEQELGVAVEGGMFISDEQLRRVHETPEKARKLIRGMIMDLKDPKVIRGPTAKPADVRIAGVSDEKAAFELALMDLEENARIAPLNRDKVAQLIMRGTRGQGGIVAVIDGPDGKPVALQVLTFEDWFWSNAHFMMKVIDYVHPDHRRSTHAAHLIQFGKWASDYMSEKFGYRLYILGGVLGTKKVREKMRLYGRQMTQVGGSFLYPFPEGWD